MEIIITLIAVASIVYLAVKNGVVSGSSNSVNDVRK